MSPSDPIRLVLPALNEPPVPLDTPAGRLVIPGRRISEKVIPIQPSLVADLTRLAREAAGRAHAPYSSFPVGAALVMADDPKGRIFTGCNVENASYGATICAERNAIQTAAAAGFRRIGLLAVSTVNTRGGPTKDRSPCGICRQVISEFSDEASLVLLDTGDDGTLAEVMDIDRLLPWGFTLNP